MKILALDASTEALSVALFDDANPDDAREHFEIAPRAHASTLLPVAQRLLDEAGWRLENVDGFAFGRGPGAFTGLRIAAGLVQGLAYGTDRPAMPVSTLAALAQRTLNRHAGAWVRVVQDARMGEIYTADFKRESDCAVLQGPERVVEPAALDERDRAGALRAGNGWSLVTQARGESAPADVREVWPHALDMAAIAAPRLRRGEGVPAADARPVYVRDDVARKPRSL